MQPTRRPRSPVDVQRTFRLSAPSRPTENDVERACLQVCQLRGYWPARLHAGTFKSADGKRWIKGVPKGTPDYALEHRLYPGFLLEVKRPGEAATPEQQQKHWEIRAGYRLAICVAESAAELARWLDEHESETRAAWTTLVSRARAP